MKQTISVLLLALAAGSVSAQFGEKNAIYMGNDLNVGGYFGADISLNYVRNEKFSAGFGFNTNGRIAKSIPSDYSPGLIGILTLGMNTPGDRFRSVRLTCGYIASLNQKGTARVNLSAGLGYVMTRVPVNWQKVEPFMGPNYTWDYQNDHAVSFVLNPRFEFPFTRYWGLSISPMIEFYEGGTFFVVGVGHIFGLLRGRTLPAGTVTETTQE